MRLISGAALAALLAVSLLSFGSADVASAIPVPKPGNTLAAAAMQGTTNAQAGPSASGQVLWAYVGEGGSLDVAAEFRNKVDAGTAAKLRVRAIAPSGAVFEHIAAIPLNEPLPAVSYVGLSDAQSGAWRVEFTALTGAGVEVPGDDTDRGIRRWGVTPRDAGDAALTGRVFGERYAQSAQALRPLADGGWSMGDAFWNETLYFMNEDGVSYRGVFRGINPLHGVILASPKGVRNGVTGPSRRASASILDATAKVDVERFHVFFELPDAAMPDTALFAGSGSRWLGPDYRNPSISDIVHTPSSSDDDEPWAGDLSWRLQGAAGAVSVQIDTDEDGVPDRKLLADSVRGENELFWDGLDGDGEVVDAATPVTVRITMTDAAEIHFTLTDVERLSGGLEVTALSGPQAGSKRMSWNDAPLGNTCEKNDGTPAACASVPAPKQATNIDSTGGVHGWTYVGGAVAGWGDARHIDNWATTPVSATAFAGLPGGQVRAVDDAVVTSPGQAVTVDVRANDVGVGAHAEVKLSNCVSSGGAWKLGEDQRITFTPVADYRGVASCRYTVTGWGGTTDTAVLRVTVGNTVVAKPDASQTASGRTVEIPVLVNDLFCDSGSRVTVSGETRHGLWGVTGGDIVMFRPNDDFHGIAKATYRVREPDGTTSQSTITVEVGNRVKAKRDSARTVGATRKPDSVKIPVLRNDQYVDPGAKVKLIESKKSHGAWKVKRGGVLSFTPKAGFHGTAKARYRVTEPDGTTATATVRVKVAAPTGRS